MVPSWEAVGVTDELELLDDPEAMDRLDGLDDLDVSGEEWVWYPEWELQNGYGANRELWNEGPPPLTTRLRERLHPVEVAYYEGRDVWKRLVAHASRKMDWRDKYGWTAEDVAQHAYEVVYPLGFEVGGVSWIKLTRRAMNRKIADLLKAQRAREINVVPDYPHDRSESPEFVPQVFSDELVERLSVVLTPRELEAVVCTYQHDMSSDMAAERMGSSPSTVRTLIERALIKMRVDNLG